MKRCVVCLIFFLLLPAALLANTDNLVMIKVVRSEALPLQLGSSVVEGCNQGDYSASCRHSSDQFVQSRMVVQSEDGKIFSIACTIESKWSNCVPLEVGESYRARIEKNGLTILYVDSKGQPRKQRYEVLYAGAALDHPVAKAAAEVAATPATLHNTEPTLAVNSKVGNSTSGAALPSVASTHPSPEVKPATPAGKALCNFSSAPSGAEITLDGAYVGNTPSALGLVPGTHEIEMSLPGFAHWTRKIEILPDSNLSVQATMEKVAP